jgi:hypothetical protein
MSIAQDIVAIESLEPRLLLSVGIIDQNMLAAGNIPDSAYYIDRDGDGYGVGAPNGPDADDKDAAVNTYDTAIAKHGSVENLVKHLGYNPTRIVTGWPSDGLRPGDLVIYQGGTYKGSYVMNVRGVHGTAENPIVFLAMPGQKVVLDATVTGITAENSSHVVFDGFVLDNSQYGGQGINIHDLQNVTFRNIESKRHTRGLFGSQNLNDMRFESMVVHDNGGHGMYLGARNEPNSNITVVDSLFYRNKNHGIQHNGRVTNMVIERNVMHSNSYAGLSLIEGVSDSVVRNNVIFNNNKQGIIFYTYYDTPTSGVLPYPETNNLVENNIVWVGRTSWEGTSGTPTDFAAVDFNDSTGVGITGTVIRNNILVTYRGPIVNFHQSAVAASTTFEGNMAYRMMGDSLGIKIGGTSYHTSALNTLNSGFRNNTYQDPGFASASVDFYRTPEKFDFSRDGQGGDDGGDDGGTPTPVNERPVLTKFDLFNGTVNEPITFTYEMLLENSDAADPDGDAFKFRVQSVFAGSLTMDGRPAVTGDLIGPGQSLVWTPPTDTTGFVYAFTLKAYDAELVSESPAVVGVGLAKANAAPTLTAITTLEGAKPQEPLEISHEMLLGASDAADADGDSLGFRIDAISGGVLTMNGKAVTVGTVIAAGQSVVWTPAATADGVTEAFQVSAWDGKAASATPVAVTVNVVAPVVNERPVMTSITPFSGITNETLKITYDMLKANSNASDPNGDAISFRVQSVFAGMLTIDGKAAVTGDLVGPGMTLEWTPPKDLTGFVYAFTLKAHDGELVSMSPAVVGVNVTAAPVNERPVLTQIDQQTCSINQPLTLTYDMLRAGSNASDPDGDAIKFRVQSVFAGTLTIDGKAAACGALVGPGQSLVWTPPADTSGVVYAFTLKTFDGELVSLSPACVTVNLQTANAAPTLTGIKTLEGAKAGEPFVITHEMLLASSDAADTDGDALSFRIEAVSSGTLTKNGQNVSAGAIIAAGESVVWTPASTAGGATGAFTVVAYDGKAASASPVAVTVTVGASAPAENERPTLTTFDQFTGEVNEPVTLTYEMLLAGSDAADSNGDAIRFRVQSIFAGTLQINGRTAVTGDLVGPGESLVWTPPHNTNGVVNAFTLKAFDGELVSESPIVVTVALEGEVEAPPAGSSDSIPANVYMIDLDGDGYGVGSTKGPDADDKDASVNTYDTAIAKHGSVENLLKHLGYNPSRIFYGMPSQKLQPGDMVIFKAGTYSGSLVINAANIAGTADKPIVFMAMPGQKVVINTSKIGIDIYDSKHVVVDGFIFDNKYGTTGGQGVSLHHSQYVTIRNIESMNHQRGIFGAQDLHNITVEGSVMHNSGSHGMYLGSREAPNSNITVKGNIFYRNGIHGMQHNGRVSNLVVENNVMHSNMNAGLSLIEGVSNSYVRNNVIFNNNKQGIILYTYYDTPSSGVKPYAQNNNVIEGNTVWVGKYAWQGGSTSPSSYAAIQFNDTTSVGMTGNIIRNNTLVSYNGPVLQFNQSKIAASTTVQNNLMWRVGGSSAALSVNGASYSADRLNNFNSLFSGNTFKDPNFESVSVDFYKTPEKFDFVRIV